MDIVVNGPDTYYLLGGGRSCIVTKGGEQLAGNSYGFEIEFCSHDSSVFAFTHVDVLRFDLAPALQGIETRGQLTNWKLESDSGGVLELVSPPLFFNDVAAAHTFRRDLVTLLTASVTTPEPTITPFGAINAVLLGTWLADVQPPLAALCQVSLAIPAALQSIATIAPWVAVGQQLNQENVDDGINIPAARMRHFTNRDSWSDYVERTVLSRSEKDWRTGYSSQLNMPMTLVGFFLYSHQKYERANARVRQIRQWIDIDHYVPSDLSDSALRKNIETWFWRSLIWEAFSTNVRTIWPAVVGDVWSDAHVRSWNVGDMTRLAAIYLMTCKVLTGAMGALSEPGQLRIQEYAWLENSTSSMVINSPDQNLEAILNVGQIDRRWLELHSAMKDLTGLWFKGALFDVILHEPIDPPFLVAAAAAINPVATAVWQASFDTHLLYVRSNGWNDALERARPDYIDDLEEIDGDTLARTAGKVQQRLCQVLANPPSWTDFRMPPDRAQRPFLHYSNMIAWEGRYDTMYSPIPYNNALWTYLVEHRFN